MAITYDAINDIISTDIECTLDDIYNADVAGGWGVFFKQGNNAFYCTAKLHIESGGTLNTEQEFCEFTKNASFTLHVKSGGELRMGQLDATYSMPCQGSIFKFSGSPLRVFRNDGTFKFYGSIIIFKSVSANVPCDIRGTADIQRSRFERGTGAYQIVAFQSVDITVNGLEIFGGSPPLVVYTTPTTPWNDIFLLGDQDYIILVFGAVTVKGVTIDDSRTHTLRMGGGTGQLSLVNAVLDLTKITYDTTEVGEHVYIQFTFDPIVCDKDGNPIENALIKMEEKQGESGSWTTLWEKATGANGKISDGAQTITRLHSNQNVETTYYHRVTVTKNGYATYGPVDITIDHKIEDDQIALDALTHGYDDVMKKIRHLEQEMVAGIFT